MLVDGDVYSSAEAWAVFAKSTGWATLVGERTGGDGIGIDPLIASLPHSGYAFRLPAVMGLTSLGVINEERQTEPDMEVSAVNQDRESAGRPGCEGRDSGGEEAQAATEVKRANFRKSSMPALALGMVLC